MNLYKPFDYLIFKIGTMFQLSDDDNYYFYQIAGFIASFQIFSLIAIEGCFISMQAIALKKLIFIGGFLGLFIWNFIRFNKKNYRSLINQWESESSKTRWICKSVLLSYFVLSLVCILVLIT